MYNLRSAFTCSKQLIKTDFSNWKPREQLISFLLNIAIQVIQGISLQYLVTSCGFNSLELLGPIIVLTSYLIFMITISLILGWVELKILEQIIEKLARGSQVQEEEWQHRERLPGKKKVHMKK